MLIIKNKIGKGIINRLMYWRIFNRHFVVLTWNKTYVLRRTKPIEDLVKKEITPDSVLTLQFKYHSSSNVFKKHVAEIDKLDYENQKLYLNIWESEQKDNLIKKSILDLTAKTNETLKKMLDTKVFNEKYGDNYYYFIALYLDKKIVTAANDSRLYSEVTLKYSLKVDSKKK